jgi:predicted  nucleic acid-binding Zn-ribbon protein
VKPRREPGQASSAGPEAEVARLKRELADARERLAAIERDGIDAFTRRRLAELEEARQVARGQALEAAVARSKAEADLKSLRDAIEGAPGLRGRVLRWAARQVIR